MSSILRAAAVAVSTALSLFSFVGSASAASNCTSSATAVCVRAICSLGPPPKCSGCAEWKCVENGGGKGTSGAIRGKPARMQSLMRR